MFRLSAGPVRRALPDAWSYASPASVLAAREAAVDRALRALLGPAVEAAELATAAQPAWAAAQLAEIAGRQRGGAGAEPGGRGLARRTGSQNRRLTARQPRSAGCGYI